MLSGMSNEGPFHTTSPPLVAALNDHEKRITALEAAIVLQAAQHVTFAVTMLAMIDRPANQIQQQVIETRHATLAQVRVAEDAVKKG